MGAHLLHPLPPCILGHEIGQIHNIGQLVDIVWVDQQGIRELAANKLQMPVRIGLPRRLHGLVETISSPAYATGVGLLLCAVGVLLVGAVSSTQAAEPWSVTVNGLPGGGDDLLAPAFKSSIT